MSALRTWMMDGMTGAMTRYAIHYRSADSRQRTGLLITDERGAAYLFCSGRLQAYCTHPDALTRLLGALQRRAPWTAVPATPRHTLEELRRLAEI